MTTHWATLIAAKKKMLTDTPKNLDTDHYGKNKKIRRKNSSKESFRV
jgi:hypothetical protein